MQHCGAGVTSHFRFDEIRAGPLSTASRPDAAEQAAPLLRPRIRENSLVPLATRVLKNPSVLDLDDLPLVHEHDTVGD